MNAPTLTLTAFLAMPVLATGPLAAQPAPFDTEGRQTLLTLQGVGAQIYECKVKADGSRAWSLREPIATLIQDGKTVGRHYLGPNWDVADGGVTGKFAASRPGATAADIPQLELQVVDHRGTGPLAQAQVVLRLNTSGGTATGACQQDGELRSVPYRADYVFLK